MGSSCLPRQPLEDDDRADEGREDGVGLHVVRAHEAGHLEQNLAHLEVAQVEGAALARARALDEIPHPAPEGGGVVAALLARVAQHQVARELA